MNGKFCLAVLFLVVITGFFCVDLSRSYEVVDVANGGSLKGKVTFTGSPPAITSLTVTKNKDHCGASVVNETFLLGPEGGVKNVVVLVEGVSQGKAFVEETYELDNKDCRFVPHVQVVPAREKLEILNSDPILHNTHAFLGTATVFNLALPLQDQKVTKRMKRPGVLSVKCDAGHTWMSAYIVVVDNPYYFVTDESGSFEITDIPPGTYQVKAWHEELGTEVKEVEVAGGAAATVSFSNLRK